MPVRVAIDVRPAQFRPLGGVGRILSNVVPLLAQHSDLDVVALSARERPLAGLGPPEVALATPFPGVATAWLQWSAPRWLRAHRDVVFHCDWYGVPFRQPVPMTATIHDLTFEHRPEWFSAAKRIAYRTQARHAARTARLLVTPSEHVKRDIIETYRVDPDRIVVAPLAVDPIFGPSARASDPASLPSQPYVVALSGAPRRRVDLALDAWRASRCGLDLVIVGPVAGPSERGVHWLGPLVDETWASCLAGAEALLYPTEDEGFGLPALEATASGTPVVCRRVGSLPEVLGDAALWVDEPGAEGFTHALRQVADDRLQLMDVRKRGLDITAARTTWAYTASVYADAFRRAAA